jgi:hypothetical protein
MAQVVLTSNPSTSKKKKERNLFLIVLEAGKSKIMEPSSELQPLQGKILYPHMVEGSRASEPSTV